MKRHVYEHWWFYVGIALILCIGVQIAVWAQSPPKYSYPKKVNTYKFRNVNKTPDSVSSAFLTSIHKEDPVLLRKCVLNRFIEQYNTAFYNNNLDNNILKELLHKTNDEFINEYGSAWYDNLNVSSVNINEDTGFGKIKLEIDGKPFKFDMETVKEREDCMISSLTFINFLGPRSFLKNAK